jgi:large subunit ribosomal protein L25
MADFTFEADVRKEFGKGFARRARMAGWIPAVVYSKGQVPVHITLPAHETSQAVRLPNALFELKVDGKKYNALVKDIQRDFVTRNIEHMDLFEVNAGQVVTVPVELRVVGETKPGTVATTGVKQIEIRVDALKIPRFVTLNIAGAVGGDHFSIGDVELPEGAVAVRKVTDIITAVKERAQRGGAKSDSADAPAAATPEAEAPSAAE